MRPVKCVKLENVRIEDKPVYFDGEFVRVGAGGRGVPLHEFVAFLATSEDVKAGRTVIAHFIQSLTGHGFAEQVGALFCGRHVERPTLQQISDVRALSDVMTGSVPTAEQTARLNVLLRAGLIRLEEYGPMGIEVRAVIATKPNQ